MTVTAACPRITPWQIELGSSDTFAKLCSEIKKVLCHEDQSIVLGWRRELRERLAQAINEASKPGWDGYGAEPLSEFAIATASYLIGQIPETTPLPDIVPCPNGEIAFEWDRGADYLFSVTTHCDLLIYAGLLGPNRKRYGQEPLCNEFPRSIASILEKYFSKA